MREYFEAEMRLLHEAAQDFAQAHPEQARMLNLNELRDRDPYIERLLEGMAFLTAHVRQRIEESEAAVSEQLLAHVCPNQLTPYPSTTIMAFEPDVYRQASQELAAGLEVLSEPVGEHPVECRFRTIAPVTLQPLAVDSVSAEEKAGRSTVIRLGFRKEGSSRLEQLDLAGLPLFLHADQPLALALYQALTQGIRRARILFPESPRVAAADLGGQRAVEPMYLGSGNDHAAEFRPRPSGFQSAAGLFLLPREIPVCRSARPRRRGVARGLPPLRRGDRMRGHAATRAQAGAREHPPALRPGHQPVRCRK